MCTRGGEGRGRGTESWGWGVGGDAQTAVLVTGGHAVDGDAGEAAHEAWLRLPPRAEQPVLRPHAQPPARLGPPAPRRAAASRPAPLIGLSSRCRTGQGGGPLETAFASRRFTLESPSSAGALRRPLYVLCKQGVAAQVQRQQRQAGMARTRRTPRHWGPQQPDCARRPQPHV